MADEIIDAIEQNPNGTDLEIALAIGVSEKAVKTKRSAMRLADAKKELAEAKERAEREKAQREEEAKQREVDEGLALLGEGPIIHAKPKPVEPDLTKTAISQPNLRYYLKDRWGGVVELKRVNSASTSVVLVAK